MKHLVTILALLFLSPLPTLSQVLFQEAFEPGFAPTDWIMTDNWGTGMWEVSTSPTHSGSGALHLWGPNNYYFTRDLGDSMEDTTLEVWFYDEGGPQVETWVSLTASPQFASTSGHDIKIGAYCQFCQNTYHITEGFHEDWGCVNGPLRSIGWHKVVVENVAGTNHCYIDDVLVHSTTFQGDWRYLKLRESGSCGPGGDSYFDDLVVYRSGPVPTRNATWATLKGQY